MQRTRFLAVTPIGEGVTGLLLLVLPAVPLALLLGLPDAAPEVLLLARVGGAANVAIGVMSGLARSDVGSPALRAVLVGILVYDLAVAAVLVSAGIGLGLAGVLLCPAVLAHLALAIWCGLCLGALLRHGGPHSR